MAEGNITSEVTKEKDWTVFAIAGRLDRMSASQSEEKADAVMASCTKFAVDLKGLSYLSSAGIRTLLRLAQKAKAGQKMFAICGAEGFVKDVIEESKRGVCLSIARGFLPKRGKKFIAQWMWCWIPLGRSLLPCWLKMRGNSPSLQPWREEASQIG